MRQSDQNSTKITVSTNLGAGSQRRFAGHKISKVRFLRDQSEFTGRFVSGSWNSSGQGCVTLWQVKGATIDGDNSLAGAAADAFERRDRLNLGARVDVNDIFIINSQQFVVSTSNGNVKIVDCPVGGGEAEGEEEQGDKMATMATYPRIHGHAASTAICVLDNEIFSGSDSGQIVRIHPASRSSSNAVRPFAEDLMGVTGLCACGQSLMVSAHTTGQLHFWDVRKRPLSAEFGIEPLNSRPVTGLNNSITALAAHPTQHSVVGFGTRDGVVSFVDIRQTNQPLPIVFKVSQEPIKELKFHPIFANNCFSLSDSGIVHWDGSMLARELNPTVFTSTGTNGDPFGQEAELAAAAMEMEEEENEHRNIWLSARASTSMQLRVLVEDEPRLLSTLDVVQGALLAGSHTAELLLLTGVNFSN